MTTDTTDITHITHITDVTDVTDVTDEQLAHALGLRVCDLPALRGLAARVAVGADAPPLRPR
ncbi:hypothetical protein GTY88_38030, partial [Streptomyces sp. SID5926]|nr:hypothetical protein [Streptomyces sp. SID5926]